MSSVPLLFGFDAGWSDGDPGDGRLRFNAPAITDASWLYVNVRDVQEAMLGDLIPKIAIGDVLVIERVGAKHNRVVCWVIGAVIHGGSYYKLSIRVRSVTGSFAVHDDLMLHHMGGSERAALANLDLDALPMPAAANDIARHMMKEVSASVPMPQPIAEYQAPEPCLCVREVPALAIRLDQLAMDVQAVASRPREPAPKPVDLEPFFTRLDNMRASLDDMLGRITDLETRAAAPIDPDDDLPSFLRSKGEDDPERPIPRPAQQIAMAQMLERLDAIERDRMRPMEPAPAPPPLAPMLRIAEAGRRQVERTSGPPHRVVEAAHLARAGQDVPLALMQVIGEAMGCGWEDAATTIIRVSDRATETAAQVYAIECAARRRIQAGEAPERVAEDSIKAIEGIGG